MREKERKRNWMGEKEREKERKKERQKTERKKERKGN